MKNTWLVWIRSGGAEKVLVPVRLGVMVLQQPFGVGQLSKDPRVSHRKLWQLTAPRRANVMNLELVIESIGLGRTSGTFWKKSDLRLVVSHYVFQVEYMVLWFFLVSITRLSNNMYPSCWSVKIWCFSLAVIKVSC